LPVPVWKIEVAVGDRVAEEDIAYLSRVDEDGDSRCSRRARGTVSADPVGEGEDRRGGRPGW
jgi:hypothetical protein